MGPVCRLDHLVGKVGVGWAGGGGGGGEVRGVECFACRWFVTVQ